MQLKERDNALGLKKKKSWALTLTVYENYLVKF